MKVLKPLLLLFVSICMPSSSWAHQILNLNPHARLSLKISIDELNRIAVEGDRIKQLFGVADQFSIESDDDGGQLFFKVTQPGLKKAVNISLITESGVTQDLSLKPEKCEAQTIILRLNPSSKFKKGAFDHSEITSLDTYHHEITRLMQLLSEKREGEGYFKGSSLSERRSFNRLVAWEQFRLEGKTLEGIVFEISNPEYISTFFEEQNFFQEGDLALSSSRTSLGMFDKALLYVIRKRRS